MPVLALLLMFLVDGVVAPAAGPDVFVVAAATRWLPFTFTPPLALVSDVSRAI